MPGHSGTQMSGADGRKLLQFPPQMQAQMLRNMRDHVETLNGILHALAGADYEGAAKIASQHLGLVTATSAKEVAHIRGLGFIGLLASGSWHQPHHLAMAKGKFMQMH